MIITEKATKVCLFKLEKQPYRKAVQAVASVKQACMDNDAIRGCRKKAPDK